MQHSNVYGRQLQSRAAHALLIGGPLPHLVSMSATCCSQALVPPDLKASHHMEDMCFSPGTFSARVVLDCLVPQAAFEASGQSILCAAPTYPGS